MGGNDDHPSSLKDLERRLKKLRAATTPPKPGLLPGGRWGQAVSLGIEMGAALAAGAGVGWLLDSWFGTKPWLLVAFIFVGIAAGMRNAFRTARRIERGPDPQDEGGDRERQS